MNSGGQRKPSEAGLREDGKHQCREELSAHLKHSPDTEIVSLGSGWRQPERQLLINGIIGMWEFDPKSHFPRRRHIGTWQAMYPR